MVYGMYPVLAAFLGYTITAVTLEHVIRTSWAQRRQVGRKGGRMAGIEKDRANVASLRKQFLTSWWVLLGPAGFANGALSALLLPYLCGRVPGELPTFSVALVHFCLLYLIGDLGLYWGHRVQHVVPYLWTHCHSFHHAVQTPSPATTVYIDPRDATLQAGLPIIVATAIVRPHAAVYILFIFLRVIENVRQPRGPLTSDISLPTFSYLFPPTSYVLRLTSYVLRPTSYVLRPTSYVLRPTSYVLPYLLSPISCLLSPVSYTSCLPSLTSCLSPLALLIPFTSHSPGAQPLRPRRLGCQSYHAQVPPRPRFDRAPRLTPPALNQ